MDENNFDEIEKIGISYSQNNSRDDIIKKDTNLNGKRFTLFFTFCLFTAVIGGSLNFGWNLGVLNVPIKVIQKFYIDSYQENYGKNITNSTLTQLWSLTTGLQTLGGTLGGVLCGSVADFFGRKNGMLLINLICLLAAAINVGSYFAKSFEMLIAGRFICGFYIGLYSGIIPMYLSEISPINLRGSIGSMNQLFLVGGIVLSNILGLPQVLGTDSLWFVLVGFIAIPALVFLGLFGAVETPKYLFSKNKKEEAKLALQKLRNDNELVEHELELLEEENQKMLLVEQATWSDLFKKKHLFRPLIVTVVLQMSQQLSGINAIIFYSTQIFDKIFTEGQTSTYITIGINGIQFLMTLVCTVLIDRLGRKLLILIGLGGMCVSCLIFATSIVVKNVKGLEYLTVVSIFAYIIFFSVGPGPIPWLITSELFGSDARGKATSIAVLVNWSTTFIVVYCFPLFDNWIGNYTFFIFGILLILFTLFTVFFVPETKGRSTDDISEIFSNQFVFFRSS